MVDNTHHSCRGLTFINNQFVWRLCLQKRTLATTEFWHLQNSVSYFEIILMTQKRTILRHASTQYTVKLVNENVAGSDVFCITTLVPILHLLGARCLRSKLCVN